MKKENYIGTIEIEGIKIDIGLDDYGQCYYFEYEKNGQKIEQSCGTYNTEVIPCIFFELCPKYRKLWTKSFLGEITEEEEKELQKWEEKIKEKEKEFNNGC